jgi:hypothetical protein
MQIDVCSNPTCEANMAGTDLHHCDNPAIPLVEIEFEDMDYGREMRVSFHDPAYMVRILKHVI